MKIQIRKLQPKDKLQVEKIFSLYWNDPEFLEELSDEIDKYLNKQNESYFIVAENENNIVGVAGYKNTPDYLKKFAKTENPVELYVIASKNKREGIGIQLKSEIIKQARDKGFSEMILFSPHTHKESWSFHDTLDFKRVAEVTPPDDETGMVWRKVF
jgi:L-amino acid N-acyltransferase YncA